MAVPTNTHSTDARPLLVVCARIGAKKTSGKKTLPGSKVITAANKLLGVELHVAAVLSDGELRDLAQRCESNASAGRKVVVVLDCERTGGVALAQSLGARGFAVHGLVSSGNGEARRLSIKLAGRDSVPIQVRWSKKAHTRSGAPIYYPGTNNIIVQECTVEDTVKILQALISETASS